MMSTTTSIRQVPHDVARPGRRRRRPGATATDLAVGAGPRGMDAVHRDATIRGEARGGPRRRGLLALAMAAALAAIAPGCDGAFETSHGAVDEGNAALVEGDAERARAAYQRAAEQIPDSPALSYIRGLAESAAGHHEQAVQLLLRAIDTRRARDLQQRVHAALGLAYSRWGLALERAQPLAGAPDDGSAPDSAFVLERWKRAVDHLEEALLRDPQDVDSLRNLEVALLRVDPPCATRDDDLEPNNRLSQASRVEVRPDEQAEAAGPAGPSPEMAHDRLTWTRQLYSCPEDPDWYALDVQAGDRIEVSLTVPRKATGRVTLDMTDRDGASLLPPTEGDAPRLALEHTVAPADGETLWFRVDNVDLDETSYGMEVVLRPPCASTEDRFEDNDDASQAVTIPAGPLPNLKICPGDEDWFAVELAEGESLFLYAGLRRDGDEPAAPAEEAAGEDEPPPPRPVPLYTEVLAEDGALLARGAPASQGRVSTLFTPGEGRYLVRIWGDDDLEARYDLMVEIVPPCPEGDDRFEDNDTVEDAVDLVEAAQIAAQGAFTAQPGAPAVSPQGAPAGSDAPPVLLARICPDDEDWWKITREGDETLIVTAIFDHAKGDLELALYDALGVEAIAVSDSSSPDQNGEAVVIAPPEGDEAGAEEARGYAVRVRGKEGSENFYILRVDRPSPSDSPSPDGEQGDEGDDQDGDDGEPDPGDEGEEERPPEREERSEPLQDALDKLDRNPQNLEAMERARTSPLSSHPPRRDW